VIDFLLVLGSVCLGLMIGIFIGLFFRWQKIENGYKGLGELRVGLVIFVLLTLMILATFCFFVFRFGLALNRSLEVWESTAVYFNNMLSPALMLISVILLYITWKTSKIELEETRRQIGQQERNRKSEFLYDKFLEKLSFVSEISLRKSPAYVEEVCLSKVLKKWHNLDEIQRKALYKYCKTAFEQDKAEQDKAVEFDSLRREVEQIDEFEAFKGVEDKESKDSIVYIWGIVKEENSHSLMELYQYRKYTGDFSHALKQRGGHIIYKLIRSFIGDIAFESIDYQGRNYIFIAQIKKLLTAVVTSDNPFKEEMKLEFDSYFPKVYLPHFLKRVREQFGDDFVEKVAEEFAVLDEFKKLKEEN